MTDQKQSELAEKGQLALQAMRRGVREAFLNVEVYDPDGKGKAYWEAQGTADKAMAPQQK